MKQLTFIFLFVLNVHITPSATAQSRAEHCIMFYNAENLFHPSDDSIAADDDFTPEGVRRWNFFRYKRKIAKICKVILAVNGWEPPDAVCLSEIENREVLNDIIFHPLMLRQQYLPLHRDSPDHRGIDVGIIYRRDRMECLDTAWIEIRTAQDQLVRTREILAATFRLKATGDTVVLFSNHWTSKYGGALETEDQRLLQARLLGAYINALLGARSPGACSGALPASQTPDQHIDTLPVRRSFSTHRISIIAGGDLNDLSGSPPVQLLSDSFNLQEVPTMTGNVHGGPSMPNASYKYRGNWASIDHVFVGGRLHAEDCRAMVFSHSFLLEEDTKYTGVKPFRTYSGFRYHGGFSDHLPLLLHFVVENHREDDRENDRQNDQQNDRQDDRENDRENDQQNDQQNDRGHDRED